MPCRSPKACAPRAIPPLISAISEPAPGASSRTHSAFRIQEEYGEAETALARARALLRRGTPLNLLKLRWLEAKILAGGGRSASAERVYREAHDEFQERGRGHVAALVGLDLLAVLSRQQKSREVRQLAGPVYGALRDLGIHNLAARAERYWRR